MSANLRTRCNQNGMSCRSKSGGYLSKNALINKIQQGGAKSPAQKLSDFVAMVDKKINEGLVKHRPRIPLRQFGNNPDLYSDLQNGTLRWVYTAMQLNDQQLNYAASSLLDILRASMPAEPTDAELRQIQLVPLFQQM
jgi:hypothetical protein